MTKSIKLQLMGGMYCISRLSGGAPIPPWADGEGFVSISRNGDELSIVCKQERVPPGTKVDLGWVCLKFVGPFAFGETGIVLSVIQPLSENGLGIFVVSTFDADCMLLKRADLEPATRLLKAAGHTIIDEPS
ncbi:ACT domain-containing protein [Caballeronia sp. SEWSISQ10-4 2]|uniref:ACT domain-containing protein n=1 Tax=Caballeronia sp. SEWSISQ10-4 2 TaxID=2937438 RepID=UPI00264EACD9|nr:ACT domain-containing protein [Caballeronia sp. SEWSISQ10-4 2]MDN7179477.1 ACT domain-containing protein [Caballeronia sp. SEWSISQ10-4 2]